MEQIAQFSNANFPNPPFTVPYWHLDARGPTVCEGMCDEMLPHKNVWNGNVSWFEKGTNHPEAAARVVKRMQVFQAENVALPLPNNVLRPGLPGPSHPRRQRQWHPLPNNFIMLNQHWPELLHLYVSSIPINRLLPRDLTYRKVWIHLEPSWESVHLARTLLDKTAIVFTCSTDVLAPANVNTNFIMGMTENRGDYVLMFTHGGMCSQANHFVGVVLRMESFQRNCAAALVNERFDRTQFTGFSVRDEVPLPPPLPRHEEVRGNQNPPPPPPRHGEVVGNQNQNPPPQLPLPAYYYDYDNGEWHVFQLPIAQPQPAPPPHLPRRRYIEVENANEHGRQPPQNYGNPGREHQQDQRHHNLQPPPEHVGGEHANEQRHPQPHLANVQGADAHPNERRRHHRPRPLEHEQQVENANNHQEEPLQMYYENEQQHHQQQLPRRHLLIRRAQFIPPPRIPPRLRRFAVQPQQPPVVENVVDEEEQQHEQQQDQNQEENMNVHDEVDEEMGEEEEELELEDEQGEGERQDEHQEGAEGQGGQEEEAEEREVVNNLEYGPDIDPLYLFYMHLAEGVANHDLVNDVPPNVDDPHALPPMPMVDNLGHIDWLLRHHQEPVANPNQEPIIRDLEITFMQYVASEENLPRRRHNPKEDLMQEEYSLLDQLGEMERGNVINSSPSNEN